jgi:hypothetical protein
VNVRLLFLGSALFAGACAAGSQSRDTSRTMDVITQEEIAEVTAATAMDVVRRLRPAWLRVRTGGDRVHRSDPTRGTRTPKEPRCRGGGGDTPYVALRRDDPLRDGASRWGDPGDYEAVVVRGVAT